MIAYFWDQFFPTIITSSVLVGIATWLLKRYFSRRIDNAFNEREKLFESKLRQQEKHKELIYNISSELMPEIQEAVYRSRNLVKETIKNKDLSHLDEMITYWTKLSDHLYKYQLFLPENIFELLHRYKRHFQNIVILLSSSVEDRTKEEASRCCLSEKDLSVLKGQFTEIEKLYSEILTKLRILIQTC